MNILEEIAGRTRERIEERKKELPLPEIRHMAEDEAKKSGIDAREPAFDKSLRRDGISFICEVKKASPSKGLIAENFPYKEIAREYEDAGAAAISCLTEPFYFRGSDEYLKEIVKSVSIPVLRKDFTVDEYMIYESRLMGASAVLLIATILSKGQLDEYRALARSLGLSALVEVHDETEAGMALDVGTGIIGVNNRNLKDFSVDINNSVRLRRMIPPEVIFVSESGMRNAEDIAVLRSNGTDAVLIGETLMRAEDKKQKLRELRGQS